MIRNLTKTRGDKIDLKFDITAGQQKLIYILYLDKRLRITKIHLYFDKRRGAAQHKSCIAPRAVFSVLFCNIKTKEFACRDSRLFYFNREAQGFALRSALALNFELASKLTSRNL